MNGAFLSLRVVVVALLGFGLLQAQESQQASLSGFVEDPAKQFIAGATVTVSNDATLAKRTLQTTGDGSYSIVGLRPGVYKLTVSADGFKTHEQKGIHLDVGAAARINVSLELGSTSESITVESGAPVLQTEKGEVSSLVAGAQVSELPLNGRNFTQLLGLGAGVVSQQTGHQMGLGQEGNPLMSVHGGRISMNKFTFDGVLAMDTGGNRGLDIFPPMDAIQETTVQKSNYSADVGGFGSGIVNLVTKSGGRDFHGDLYEYFRNDQLDSRNFFSNSRQVIRLNDFGFTLGGPIYIPGKYNTDKSKDFFFVSESWSRRVGPQINSYTAPPQEVFTAQVPTLAMRQGNFSSLGKAIVDPTTKAQFPGNVIPANQIDPNALLLINDFYPVPNRSGAVNFVHNTASFTKYHEDLIHWDHNFNSNWLWSTRYVQDDWSQNQDIARPSTTILPTFPNVFQKPGKNLVSKLTTILSPRTVNLVTFGYSFNRINNDPLAGQRPSGLTIPQAYASNYFNLIPDISMGQGYASLGLGTQTLNSNPIYTWKDDLSIQVGRNSLKVGVESIYHIKVDKQHSNEQGTFTFDGSATGNAIADLLVGRAFSYTENNTDPGVQVSAWDNELYFQDDFRVTPNLTVNGGIRWYLIRGSNGGAAVDDNISTFVPSVYNPAAAPQLLANGAIVPGTGDPVNGIVTPADTKGLNIGASLTKPVNDAFGPRLGLAWTPFGGKTVIRTGYGINYFWGTASNDGRQTNPPFVQSVNIQNTLLSNPLGAPGTLFPPSVNSLEVYPKQPSVQSWNFTVQRELARDWSLEIGYAGTRGTHLPRTIQLNQADPTLTGNANLRRPFVGYSTINYNENAASSLYNGLETSLTKRFSKGLLVQVSYTWSKALADVEGAPLDSRNLRLDYGLADLDRTHVFVANYVWELPFFRSDRGFATALLRNWELSGIVSFESGLPVNVTQSGDVAGFGGGTGAQRPNRVGDPSSEATGTVSEWFNTAAFQAVTQSGQVGNSPYNAARGPGVANLDTSLFRNFRLTERFQGQLGIETFNTLNHTQFEGVDGNFNSQTFGQITSARDPRLVQLRARLTF